MHATPWSGTTLPWQQFSPGHNRKRGSNVEAHGGARRPGQVFNAGFERSSDARARWIEEMAGLPASVPNPDLHKRNGQKGSRRQSKLRQSERDRTSELVRRIRPIL